MKREFGFADLLVLPERMKSCFDFSTKCLKAQSPVLNVEVAGEVMFLDMASLEMIFFIWTLRPRIKKGKKKKHLF